MRPYIEIKASQSSNLLLWQSKFCGLPYLPEKNVYPRNSQGKYLYMIAQINFEELPRLEPYPEKGILQFWIEDDDLYGMNFNDQTKQDSFKVVYYSDVQQENLVTDFSFLPHPEYSPFTNTSAEYSLNFLQKKMPPCISDYHYHKFFSETDEAFDETYIETYDSNGHRIGGYAHFTQEDPRDWRNPHKEKEHLLLQIDTDDENQIMWGDCGVANFFISENDLKKKEFNNILYNYDCY